ncbi:MAG: DNA polymerase III subunit gamma/tau [Candidatus Paceibacterota bacterium]|jgi:DNA polymerase-3 subunit gamma/tau
MSHTVLYRKYRPTTLDDVIGQDHIVKVLKGALKQGNVSHSYLFSGSRGIGKTSIARILAHEVGCSDNDIYEIDAASNNGVDDIRTLSESARTLPFDSKYKVYILDEVHMLSKAAANAFLKTLEEPPAHVIFMLATTDPEKLPETIVSRCQVFTLKKPTDLILKNFVLDVAKKEGFKLDTSSAELIALLGDGSFRDTHGILEKVISFSADKKISKEEIEQVTGAPSSELVYDFLSAISEKNLEGGLKAIRKATEQNIDMRVYLKLILYKFRTFLLIRLAPEMKKEIESDISENDKEFFTALVKSKSNTLDSKTLALLLECYQTIQYAFIPELPLELALIKIVKGE